MDALIVFQVVVGLLTFYLAVRLSSRLWLPFEALNPSRQILGAVWVLGLNRILVIFPLLDESSNTLGFLESLDGLLFLYVTIGSIILPMVIGNTRKLDWEKPLNGYAFFFSKKVYFSDFLRKKDKPFGWLARFLLLDHFYGMFEMGRTEKTWNSGDRFKLTVVIKGTDKIDPRDFAKEANATFRLFWAEADEIVKQEPGVESLKAFHEIKATHEGLLVEVAPCLLQRAIPVSA